MKDTKDFDVISLQEAPEEKQFDFHPTQFDEYKGQAGLKEKLAMFTQAAKERQEPLDHLLLFGPPGLGKTTLSHIMSRVMDVQIKLCSGPMLERTGDLVALLSGLQERDILFIDEIHRMPTNVEEILYSAMENFRVDVIIGQGAGAQSVSLPLFPFTLIGATTKSGMISAPLRSRFGIIERLDYYDDQALSEIIQQSCGYLKLPIEPEAAFHIAHCSRGTPRIAKKITRRVRDFAQVKKCKKVTKDIALQALAFLGIDEDGLSSVDNLILSHLIHHFKGGPVGLETLASMIGEDPQTIEEVYEPFLMQKGLLERTSRGRQIPHIKLPTLHKKYGGQTTLFHE